MKQSLIVRFAVFTAAIFLATGLALADTPTLTHLWSFDGDLTDSVGSVNGVGTDVTTTGTGVSGNAAYFNGSTSMVLAEGNDVLSSSSWTVSFWEYMDTADTEPDGYYFSDAAGVSNLYTRRYKKSNPAETESISACNGKIADYLVGNYTPTDAVAGTWINHTITVTDAGETYWYLNGDLEAFIYRPVNWTGLTTTPETTDTEGLVIGNRLAGSRTYYGYLDEFQVYSGSVDTGMAEYLYDNPGATLATYNASAYPDAGIPDTTPGPDNVLHWTFDSDLTEAGGNTAATGTAIGNAVIQATAGVDGGGALYFDGDDDAVSIDGDVVPTGSVSFSFWAKTDGTTNGYMLCDGEENSNFFIRRSTDDTDYITGGIGDDVKGANIEATGPYATDTWQHIVVVSSQETGEVYCYVDGELVEVSNYARAEIEDTGVLVGILSDLYIGNRTNLGRDFKGWIDDLQIYDGTLTADEVSLLCDNPGQDIFAVPEPSTIVLLLGAVIGLFIIRRR